MQRSDIALQTDINSDAVNVHKTAVLHPKTHLSKGVVIGPYCVVGENVNLGEHTILDSHVVLEGWTTIGDRCRVHSHAVIGGEPQDLKFRGGESYVEIGSDTVVREFVTINRGTKPGEKTIIGNSNLLMAYVHVAHNCEIGNHVVMANAATLAGHVIIEDHAIIGGLSGIHQFVRIGAYSIIGGCSKVTQDVPPYIKVDGHPVAPHGLNSVGLVRHRFSAKSISALKSAYRTLYRSNLRLEEALNRIENELAQIHEVAHLVEFIRASLERRDKNKHQYRGICR